MSSEKCSVCNKNKGSISIGDGRKICHSCNKKWEKTQAYEAEKVAETAKFQNQIQDGLCKHCAKKSYCEMYNDPRIGECRPGDRCTEFVDKKGLTKKEKNNIKDVHGQVPIANNAGKPKNKKAQAPHQDVYNWITTQDFSDEEQTQVAELVDKFDDEKQLKKEITKMILRRGKK